MSVTMNSRYLLPIDDIASKRTNPAAEAIAALGMPHHDQEDHKYTSLRYLADTNWAVGSSNGLAETLQHFGLSSVEGPKMVFVNGHFRQDLSSVPTVAGLTIQPIEESALNHLVGTLASTEETVFDVTAHCGKLLKPAIGATAALNTLGYRDGIAIHIARNAQIEDPIQLIFVDTEEKSFQLPRILIKLEPMAEATIVETYASLGDIETLTNAVIEVFVGENANLEHIKVQEHSLRANHISLTEAKVEQSGTYRHFNVNFGGKVVRNDVNVFLDGSYVHVRMDGVTCIEGDQHVDNHTRLDHAKPHCESFEIYKHLLDGESTAVFNGKIFVHEDAQKTDAKQTNQAILLSPTATMNTKPQLEIFADDVKCTHGATIGQLRDEALFYMQSRGIPFDQARALMVYAFAAEVLEEIKSEPIAKELEAKLFAKLGQKADS